MKNALATILANKGFAVNGDNSHLVKSETVSRRSDGSEKAFVVIELFINEDNNEISHTISATWETLEENVAIINVVRENLRVVDKLNSLR